MSSVLIGIHAGLGELGVLCFLWCLVEIINPIEQRIKRARIAAMIGTLLIFSAWIIGGYYYLYDYGSNVKPLIKAGPEPWAHLIFTETKEHIFLFLPFLSILATGLLYKYSENIGKIKLGLILLLILIILLGLAMAGMGYLISAGARAALEAKT